MKSWTERTHEAAHLFNPAFCTIPLSIAISSYSSKQPPGMPFPLCFMVLPVVLHKGTRELLPRSTSTSMVSWIQDNPVVRLGFHQRVITLKPYTKEAICFGSEHSWIDFKTEGQVVSELSQSQIQRKAAGLNGEAKLCVKKAALVGRWFAMAGSPETVMSLWGIRP